MTLRGILWNARGWRTKDAELIIQSRECDFLCITETKNRREDGLSIPGFNTYVCNYYRQGEGGAGRSGNSYPPQYQVAVSELQ